MAKTIVHKHIRHTATTSIPDHTRTLSSGQVVQVSGHDRRTSPTTVKKHERNISKKS